MARLKHLSVAELRRELDRRERGSRNLLAQHVKLAKQLTAIDAKLADLGVAVPVRGRRGRKPGPKPGRKSGRRAGRRVRRATGGMTLVQALEKGISTGRTVSPLKAAKAAKRAGYMTSSKSFGVQVATALAKAPGFRKVGRGQYRRVGGGSRAKRAGRARRTKGGRLKKAIIKTTPSRMTIMRADSALKPGSGNTGPRGKRI